MQIENFKTFIDLVDTGSFSKTAKLNNVTQSAVSQQLKGLERSFNIAIIDRNQKHFILTPEGKLLYEKLKEILLIYEPLKSEIQGLHKNVSGIITIQTVSLIGLYELPTYIKYFKGKYPDILLNIQIKKVEEIYESVKNNIIDIGLISLPYIDPDITIIPFREDQLVAICYPQHPFANINSPIKIDDFIKSDFISFTHDIMLRRSIDCYFRDHNIKVNTVMEFNETESIKRAVIGGYGISIVPEGTITEELKNGLLKLIQLETTLPKKSLAIIKRKNASLTLATQKFIEIITHKPYSPDSQ